MPTRQMPSPDGARNRDNLLRQSQIDAYCTKNALTNASGDALLEYLASGTPLECGEDIGMMTGGISCRK